MREKKIPFALAHTYLGHWTTRLSRYIVRAGLLGDVRWVDSYYLQGWLATKLEDTGQQQASWRVDPKKAGGSGCGGDIGTHALMQLPLRHGLGRVGSLGESRDFVKGRPIDDHFTAYCHLSNGAGGWSVPRRSPSAISTTWDGGVRNQGHFALAAGRSGSGDDLADGATRTAFITAAR